MTFTEPYLDQRSALRRTTPDWLVTERRSGSVIQHRFTSEDAAWRFYFDQQDETPDDPGVAACGAA